ncbi:MAG TPA: NYN domain-containing protein [Shinella sp.]|jgi:hypothetical protein|uniref:NYN domain-containing protein n=1 Tax=Shinella sp. TaxID=1870904 RepID=UPI002E10C851|nr:NYN domain-containing protein [Shinella sp.]
MTERRVALFIDAENLPASASSVIVEEAMRQGKLSERRIYGDFSLPALAPWLGVLPRHALSPFQTAGGAIGKNGADIALVIDAMEMLCDDSVDVFCLATSDGDFTQLAMRIRQRGKIAVGIGRAAASARFREACDVFEALPIVTAERKPVTVAAPVKKKPATGAAKVPGKLEPVLLKRAMLATASPQGGWVTLPTLMKSLQACVPSFSVKAYGHRQLHKLLAFSGVELTADHKQARLKAPALRKVVDNG